MSSFKSELSIASEISLEKSSNAWIVVCIMQNTDNTNNKNEQIFFDPLEKFPSYMGNFHGTFITTN